MSVFSRVLPVLVRVVLVYAVVACVSYRLESLLQVPRKQKSTSGKENVIIKIFTLGITWTHW